jgi:hypothetical protein
MDHVGGGHLGLTMGHTDPLPADAYPEFEGGITMKSKHLLWVLVAAALIAAGCGGKGTSSQTGEAATTEAASPTSGEGHAAGIVPGSYQDWCEEHQVQETQCTRCDASLIAAFQAAGDWDAEHGLPKSQCTTCDPNLKIVRPPKPEGK